MTEAQKSTRLIAYVIMLMLIFNFNQIKMLFEFNVGMSIPVKGIIVGYLFLNGLAAYGLYNFRTWGYYCAYIAIIYTTIFLSIPYIPFITQMMPLGYRSSLMIAINICMFFITMFNHYKSRQ